MSSVPVSARPVASLHPGPGVRAAGLAALVCLPLVAAGFDLPQGEPDPLTGKDINGVCAGCHGDVGQGGKEGQYPRIAGLPVTYIYRQVKLFQQNTRPNLPMLEHVHERQLSDIEIRDIANYLAAISLPTRLEPMAETDPRFDAYERMMALQRMVQIPFYPGDAGAGRRLYNKECRSCHGSEGWGEAEKQIPQLAGQYSPTCCGRSRSSATGFASMTRRNPRTTS